MKGLAWNFTAGGGELKSVTEPTQLFLEGLRAQDPLRPDSLPIVPSRTWASLQSVSLLSPLGPPPWTLGALGDHWCLCVPFYSTASP